MSDATAGSGSTWHLLGDVDQITEGAVMTVVADDVPVCLVHTKEHGITALDNRCPHQGGPLGEGHLDGPWLICPWHGYEYHPANGTPPPGFSDSATSYPVQVRGKEIYVSLPDRPHQPTVSDQLVEVMTEWGVDTVFGMVGHSNLGFAEALRRAADGERLRYFGVRHEGAAAFAASAYGKLTGRPAACFGIAGPGSTNLLTGLWDAKMDRAPVLALSGQVASQVLGPGAFQEVDLSAAFQAVRVWGQTVLTNANASELMALAIKHAEVERGVTHLILPDDVQAAPAAEPAPRPPREGRIADHRIAPPAAELERACQMIASAKRPALVLGHGARFHAASIIALAEHIDAALITTFKGKGIVPDDHPLACGVLGRSGTPVGSGIMAKADLLVVLGASFSEHTGIADYKPIIQVDYDRMMLGKGHAVTVPLWGDIETTVAGLHAHLEQRQRPEVRADIAARRDAWRSEKRRKRHDHAARGARGIHPALVFDLLGTLVPDDAVLCVDVGNNTYSFGRFFECKRQSVLMSGYLGSIGFAFPAALGAWAAVGDRRKVVSVSGDGGFGQYLAEFTTAVKYHMPICHVLLNNGELAKISKEQRAASYPVWQTSLHNPDFAAYARLCGGMGLRVTDPGSLQDALREALAVEGPSLVEVVTDPMET